MDATLTRTEASSWGMLTMLSKGLSVFAQKFSATCSSSITAGEGNKRRIVSVYDLSKCASLIRFMACLH